MSWGAVAMGVGGAVGAYAAGGGGSDAPSMDANEQAFLLREQARLNRLDQTTPFGSLTFQGPDRTEAVLELDPQTQQTVDALQQTAASRAQQLPGTAFDPSIPAVGGTEAGSLGPFDQSTQAQQAVFEQARNLLEPQFERQEESLRQTLANQGLPAGGEAFEDQFNQFQRNRNRAFEDAAFRAVQQGNQRQNQLFEQGLAELGAQQQVRNQNLNEVQALMLGQQVQGGQPGSFFGPSQVDVMGPASMAQQSQMAQFQADQQRQQAALGGLSSLGSAYIMSQGQ